ncbi:hypothetical protein [Streptomyces sp. RKAG293]|uniref:hypothetical protein n=1 Tax=Streptomyces sp. RKAG293 TaxID=2893403 RepID=UPI00203442A0|nr:hypothetical protein [Streptomyces sp. RKAG293]MCM2416612.1 hypothetical protein [Streptomyces sp. RKAG293]
MIEEWPLAERLSQTMGETPTASHTRALLPVIRRFGLTAAADPYQQIRARAAVEDRRLTASLTGQIVKVVLKSAGWPAEETQFQAATRQLMTAEVLPLPTSARTERRALARSATDPPQPPSPPVQRSADSHEEVTAQPADSMTVPDRDQIEATRGFLDDPASENILQSIHFRAITLEGEISAAVLSGSVNIEHGDLWQEIVQRLTHAVELVHQSDARA